MASEPFGAPERTTTRPIPAAGTDLPIFTSFRHLRGGYDHKSLGSFVLLVAVQVSVGLAFPHHLTLNKWLWRDPLLWGTWAVMTLLLTWDVRPRRDVALLAVGFAGGLVIEWWGTTSQLWWYFTKERPPLWILPAWPVAALATDRIGRVLTLAEPVRRRARMLYWLLLPAFIVWMAAFMQQTFDVPSSWLVMAIMLGTLCWRPQPSRDVCLFLAGVLLGVFLETWGTSRRCWTYYTHETPPWVAVAAHGFAAVAFSRGVELMRAVTKDDLLRVWRSARPVLWTRLRFVGSRSPSEARCETPLPLDPRLAPSRVDTPIPLTTRERRRHPPNAEA